MARGFLVIGLLAVSCCVLVSAEMSSESWEDDTMHDSSDDSPRSSMDDREYGDDKSQSSDDGTWHGSDDGMHGRDDGMHGRDDRSWGRRGDRVPGRDDRKNNRDDRSWGRTDRPFYGRDDSKPDYTPWWIRRRAFRPFNPGFSRRHFSPFFPRSSWWDSYPSRRRSSSYPWDWGSRGSWGSWGSHRSSSPFFPRSRWHDDITDDSYPQEQGRSDSLFGSRSDDSSWGRGWSDRTWGIPSRRNSWGLGWSRDRSWGRPFWWDDSNFWRIGSPRWRSNGWNDDDFSRSRNSWFSPRTGRDPWGSGRWGSRWGNRWGNRWDDDFDSFSSRERDGDSDDWWGYRSRDWYRPSPWGRSWGRGFASSYRSFDDSLGRNAFIDPFGRFFGPRLAHRAGVSPITAPPVTPSYPGVSSPFTSPESLSGDDDSSKNS